MIEQEIFKKSIIIPEKCIQYGFKKKKQTLTYHHMILNDSFEIIITISNNKVVGTIIDKDLNEEYTNYRIENQIGEFTTTIRTLFIDLLVDIKNKCTIQNDFVFPQANRISNWIQEKYKDIPEYLWDDDKNAVFRNKETKKWYGIIMYINKNKIDKDDKMVEIMNVKLPPKKIDSLVKEKGFYRAYHMNKTHWITFILDETVDDSILHRIIEISYQYTIKK